MIKNQIIFHVCRLREWEQALKDGFYQGSEDDIKDGYIHFSTALQLRESVRKHRSGQNNLIILSVNTVDLGGDLKWETSRNGELFPHLYGLLETKKIFDTDNLMLDSSGKHFFPHSTGFKI